MNLAELEKEREGIIKEVSQIKQMRRGSVTEQFLPVKLKDKEKPVLRGPYYVHTTKIGGRTISKRIKIEELGKYREEINNFRRFQGLMRQLVEINEKINEHSPTNVEVFDEAKKKLQKPSKRKSIKKSTD